MMIKKLQLRSNGNLVGYNSDGEIVHQVNLLNPEIEKLFNENLVNAETEMEIQHLKEPIKLSQWFDFFSPEAKKE